jgi:hypothetical protein
MITSKYKCKIVVGINSLVSTTQPAYSNHIQFFFRLGRNYPEIDFILVNPSRMGIDRMRNLCAKTALEHNADYILFLDDDVLVPFDSLKYLFAANADIVAGDVLIRGYPFNHMCFRYPLIADKFDLEGKNLKAIESWNEDEINKGIVDVDAVGFSLCLIKTSLLKAVPGPWFLTGPRNTEDVYFCIKAKLHNPSTSIKVCVNVICAHILWAETISIENRAQYKIYMERQFGAKPESLVTDQPVVAPPSIAVHKEIEVDPKATKDYADVVLNDMNQFNFVGAGNE